MKPTLNVQGVDPARIECRTEPNGVQSIDLDNLRCAWMSSKGRAWFDGSRHPEHVASNAEAVMNAAIDHWRATGRLFPEPTPEPVECVCGGKPKLCSSVDLPVAFVVCIGVSCNLRANTVAQWNTIQAALKAAKK